MTNLNMLGIRGWGICGCQQTKGNQWRIIHQKSKQSEGGAGYSTQPVHGIRLTKLIKLSSLFRPYSVKSQRQSVRQSDTNLNHHHHHLCILWNNCGGFINMALN